MSGETCYYLCDTCDKNNRRKYNLRDYSRCWCDAYGGIISKHTNHDGCLVCRKAHVADVSTCENSALKEGTK